MVGRNRGPWDLASHPGHGFRVDPGDRPSARPERVSDLRDLRTARTPRVEDEGRPRNTRSSSFASHLRTKPARRHRHARQRSTTALPPSLCRISCKRAAAASRVQARGQERATSKKTWPRTRWPSRALPQRGKGSPGAGCVPQTIQCPFGDPASCAPIRWASVSVEPKAVAGTALPESTPTATPRPRKVASARLSGFPTTFGTLPLAVWLSLPHALTASTTVTASVMPSIPGNQWFDRTARCIGLGPERNTTTAPAAHWVLPFGAEQQATSDGRRLLLRRKATASPSPARTTAGRSVRASRRPRGPTAFRAMEDHPLVRQQVRPNVEGGLDGRRSQACRSDRLPARSGDDRGVAEAVARGLPELGGNRSLERASPPAATGSWERC